SRPARRVDLRRSIEDVQRFGIAAAPAEVAPPGTARVGEIDVMAMLLQEICGPPEGLIRGVFVLERQSLCEGVPEVGSRFQILDGDPELRSQLAERLDRRSPCAGLDPRDVRVRDAWRRQFALRQLAFEPQSPHAPSYCLCSSL